MFSLCQWFATVVHNCLVLLVKVAWMTNLLEKRFLYVCCILIL